MSLAPRTFQCCLIILAFQLSIDVVDVLLYHVYNNTSGDNTYRKKYNDAIAIHLILWQYVVFLLAILV
jgi:hypothetical protein